MNVVLIGYRGTGKSSVGKILVARLGHALLSTDEEVVRIAGQTIPEIVEQHGWEKFRDLESQVCQKLDGREGLIVDTGGGVILRPQNVAVLKQVGPIFWLTASVEAIAKRIGGDTQRPSLTGVKSFVDEIQEVLRERLPKYQSAADHVIETEGKSLRHVADEVLARL
jgi:shikimate kinase